MIRSGGSDDISAILALLDQAAEWLVAQGRANQWGTGRQSTNPHRLEQAKSWAAGGLSVAVADNEIVGALIVGSPPTWAPAISEPHLYIKLLVADRRYRGVGARLLEHAQVLAQGIGVRLLRLDCFAGDDDKLVRYYEGNGFTVTAEFEGKAYDGSPWPCAILEQRL
jgi:ribosomal protein S18 acetylase RimI-like enzyme